MPKVEVRPASREDVQEIVEFSSALFREDAGRRDPSTNLSWPEEAGHYYFAGMVEAEDSVCLVAVLGGAAVGYLAGRLNGGTHPRPVVVAELESMYVRAERRSAGVGEKLVGEFLVWAREGAAERASVTAYATNERAIRFYRGMGFDPKSVSLEMGLF